MIGVFSCCNLFITNFLHSDLHLLIYYYYWISRIHVLYFTMQLEKEISRLSSGLQTTKEVLQLSRSMVRCDTIEQRLMCMDVLCKTDNQACLRWVSSWRCVLFLSLHRCWCQLWRDASMQY